MTSNAVPNIARRAAKAALLALASTPLLLAAEAGLGADPGKTAGPRSLSEFQFLIGNWTCRITEAGKPETRSSVRFEWMYDGKVLKETVTSPAYSGQFMTVLDKRSNTFKGVAVGNDGSYIVWENPGMVDGKSSEVGYLFADGKMTPASRSDFERLSDTHYVIRDFGADAPGGKGRPADTEDCSKDPRAESASRRSAQG